MTQPINPNTNIPMSLEVEKLQQLRNNQSTQQQGQLAQQSSIEEQIRDQRVNSNNEPDQAHIREKEEKRKGQKHPKKDKRNRRENSPEEETATEQAPELSKGKFIDIKV